MENYDPQVSSSWDGEMPPSVGLIPRTVQKIFDSTEQLRDKGWGKYFLSLIHLPLR